MKRIFYKKFGLIFLLGMMVMFSISVRAAYFYMAPEIGYKSSDETWKVKDIGEALDEMYASDYAIRNSCSELVAQPNLGTNNKLIPITIAKDGKVTYANTESKWYNYCDAVWANAVILIDNPSKNYGVGDIISEVDIESYFVWIPKYKYKLWNTGTALKTKHSIEVIFTTEDTEDEEGVSCKTPMTSGNVGNCNNGEWMTHPAFISMGVDGFWVGKFETGYQGATTKVEAEVTSSDSSKIIVKPNVYSWRNNTLYNMFVSSYNYERELNSHMMKNTEWGAVAYLSHSDYGINNEININNNSSYKTGYSALATTNQHTHPGTSGDGAEYNDTYATETGVLASTTGNITGVYDMSGGSHSYMASYRNNTLAESGFTATTIANYDAKYFDVYNAASEIDTYEYMILGDATGEMGPFNYYAHGDGTERYHNSWYADYSYFVGATEPWFVRGGFYNNGVLASQFLFHRYTGAVYTRVGSRVVLAP